MTLQFDQYYHIFNRGNNRETLFREERNYHYFLERYTHYISPIADTFTYCLLPNHFHFLVRIKAEEEMIENLPGLGDLAGLADKVDLKPPSKYFSNLFNAYTKAINKTYQRTGSLFEKPFHRKVVTSDAYLTQLVLYIHFNPQKHGLIDDFRLWPFSSYEAMLFDQPTRIYREEVLGWFGGLVEFKAAHANYRPEGIDEEFGEI